jgi:outer membrane lipoprotein LolB
VSLAAALGRAAACALLLAACATPRVDSMLAGPALSGRLSVRVDAEPVRAVNATFELRGDAQRGMMVLSSPLGSTLAEARWSPQETVLSVPGNQTRYADLDELAAQALGERLPMAALFDWLRGRPWDGAPSAPLADDSSMGFAQLGWQIRLDRYDEGFVDARRREPPPRVIVRARIDRPAP